MAAALAAICLLALPVRGEAGTGAGAGAGGGGGGGSDRSAVLVADLVRPGNAQLRQFYYYRANRPLWIIHGRLSPAAQRLVQLVDTADLDDVRPEAVFADDLHRAVERAENEGTPEALDRAELALSRSFAAFVRFTAQAPAGGLVYEHVSLQPRVPGIAAALQDAAAAPSLMDYVDRMAWLHPLYAPLRRAFAAAGGRGSAMSGVFLANLARIRALPADPPGGRHVLVNAAAARLWMYEGREAVDSMNVVVGKVDHQTPMISGYIRYAIFNPYWNVPADLTRDRIARRVLQDGPAYLRKGGYQVMSGWTAEATVVDPQTVDWRAVASGAADLRVRQLPGAANSMGRVKFEFPNALGIYLHDTPEQELMARESRLYSSGCVRLQDAPRLGRWLFQGTLPVATGAEQRVDLPRLVPVYVTYLTLQLGDDGHLVVLGDPYGRDGAAEPALAGRSGPVGPAR